MTVGKVVTVAVGGAAGCVARYLVAAAMTARWGPGWPWGTFIVNITGSFAIGLLMALFGTREDARLTLVTGFLGGYTTFSAFQYELFMLRKDGAAAYAIASVCAGFAAVWLGAAIGRRLG